MAEQPPATLPADFFEKQGAAPPSTLPADFDFEKAGKPGAYQRFFDKSPLKAGEENILTRDWASDPMGITTGLKAIGKAAWGPIQKHLEDATDALKSGNHLEAGQQLLKAVQRVADPAGTMIKDVGQSVAKDVSEGNLAGATGTLSPFIAGAAAGVRGGSPEVAAETTGNARSDFGDAARAFIAKPKAGQPVPGTSAIPPGVVDALALHPKFGTLFSLLKRFSNASDAMGGDRGARVEYTPPTAAGKPGVMQVPGTAIRPVEYGAGQGHFGEEVAPSSPATPTARTPIWEGNPEPAPPTAVTLGDLSKPSRADLQVILDGRRAEALASDPRNAPAVIQRIKALSQESAAAADAKPTATLAEVAKNPVETFNRVVRAGMISDFLKDATKKLGYSEADLKQLQTENPARFNELVQAVSKTPEGTKVTEYWRPSTKAASSKTRTMVQERVSPTEPRTPGESEDLSDLLQQSLDALKSKKGRK